MVFQAGNVHEIANPFNLKEKKDDMKSGRIWTHVLERPENLVYHANWHQTTADIDRWKTNNLSR